MFRPCQCRSYGFGTIHLDWASKNRRRSLLQAKSLGPRFGNAQNAVLLEIFIDALTLVQTVSSWLESTHLGLCWSDLMSKAISMQLNHGWNLKSGIQRSECQDCCLLYEAFKSLNKTIEALELKMSGACTSWRCLELALNRSILHGSPSSPPCLPKYPKWCCPCINNQYRADPNLALLKKILDQWLPIEQRQEKKADFIKLNTQLQSAPLSSWITISIYIFSSHTW